MDKNVDKSKLNSDKIKAGDRLQESLQGKELAKKLRADLGASNPSRKEVLDYLTNKRAEGSVREKLDDLTNVRSDLSKSRVDLPENLKKELQRLDDLADPKKDPRSKLDI